MSKPLLKKDIIERLNERLDTKSSVFVYKPLPLPSGKDCFLQITEGSVRILTFSGKEIYGIEGIDNEKFYNAVRIIVEKSLDKYPTDGEEVKLFMKTLLKK